MKSNNSIIMVDDNEVDYFAAKRFIRKSKLDNELIYFESGEDFLDYLKKYSYDDTPINIGLILMDVNMPGLNGHDTTKLIREIPKFQTDPPIYILTSSRDFKDKESAKESGANGFLEKPFVPEGYIDLFNSFV